MVMRYRWAPESGSVARSEARLRHHDGSWRWFEVTFTNLQFIALAADATKAGDHVFAQLIQSIQSDEARHAQIGMEVMRLMIRAGRKAEVQKLVDISFWRNWRAFAPLTGLAMDYYTPLERREHSFKEFMYEWVIAQFARRVALVECQRTQRLKIMRAHNPVVELTMGDVSQGTHT